MWLSRKATLPKTETATQLFKYIKAKTNVYTLVIRVLEMERPVLLKKSVKLLYLIHGIP